MRHFPLRLLHVERVVVVGSTTRVRMHCSRCGRVLDEFRVTEFGWAARSFKRRRPYGLVKVAPPPGRPTALDTEFELHYRCHPRCGRVIVAIANDLSVACGRAAAGSFTI